MLLQKLRKSKEDYLNKVEEEVKLLVKNGYVLEDDIEGLCTDAASRYDHIFETGSA